MPILKSKQRADVAEVLATLNQRLAELEARDKTCLAEILDLERAGVIAKPPGSMPQAQHAAKAEALLAGSSVDASAHSVPDEIKLFELRDERALIARALELGRQRGFQLRVAAAATIVGDLEAAWQENIKAVAARLVELKNLADERKRLLEEWTARTGALPCPFPCIAQADRAAGSGIVGDAVYEFLVAARAAGITK